MTEEAMQRMCDAAELYCREAVGPIKSGDLVGAVNALLARCRRLDMALQSLTPGGSEFVGNPDLCVAFVREEVAKGREARIELICRKGMIPCVVKDEAAGRDRTAMTGPLTIGQELVARWEGLDSGWSEPADLAEAIDKEIARGRGQVAQAAAVEIRRLRRLLRNTAALAFMLSGDESGIEESEIYKEALAESSKQ